LKPPSPPRHLIDWSDDDDSFNRKSWQKPREWTAEDLGLEVADFEGLDIDCLDDLPIKDLNKFKGTLKKPDDTAIIGPRPIRGMEISQSQWWTIVQAYSGCALSFSKDKLVAISGMARKASEDMNCKYLAGMWRKDLEHQLLWKVTEAMLAIRKDGTRGPSWSWTSVDGAVEIGDWSGYFYGGSAVPNLTF